MKTLAILLFVLGFGRAAFATDTPPAMECKDFSGDYLTPAQSDPAQAPTTTIRIEQPSCEKVIFKTIDHTVDPENSVVSQEIYTTKDGTLRFPEADVLQYKSKIVDLIPSQEVKDDSGAPCPTGKTAWIQKTDKQSSDIIALKSYVCSDGTQGMLQSPLSATVILGIP